MPEINNTNPAVTLSKAEIEILIEELKDTLSSFWIFEDDTAEIPNKIEDQLIEHFDDPYADMEDVEKEYFIHVRQNLIKKLKGYL